MARKKTVVLGLLGTTLDAGLGPNRWERWRPTVDLHRLPDLIVDRFELFYNGSAATAASGGARPFANASEIAGRGVARDGGPPSTGGRAAREARDSGLDQALPRTSDPHELLAHRVKADIRELSPETQVKLHRLGIADPWNFAEVYEALLDVAEGYPFRDDEEYLVHLTTGSHVAQICLFLLTEARWFPAKLLQISPPRVPGEDRSRRKFDRGGDRSRSGEGPKSWADTRQTRDHGSFQIFDLNLSTYDRLGTRLAKIQQDAQGILKAGIATRNKHFNHTIARIEQVATSSTSPMLILGPTGAGKSFLARRIFDLKKARHQVGGEFVDVNCATIRGDGAMSALFGHAKGAFTGAQGARDGLLVRADKGVLFLDEIGELGLEEQGMLLRALEEKTFLPLGADKPRSSDFQLISGTNCDLAEAVAAGLFREDLYARIRLWTFRLPGLAERREDLAPNLEHELARWVQSRKAPVIFPDEAKRRYLAFAEAKTSGWTGNFRDLSASVERLVTLAEGGRITAALVDEEILRLQETWRTPTLAASGAGGAGSAGIAKEVARGEQLLSRVLGAAAARVDSFDRVQLAHVLAVCLEADSLSEAGRQLFEVSRTERATVNDADRLRKYLTKWGISFDAIKRSA
jgi:transcriptional regulatory protein RtcR